MNNTQPETFIATADITPERMTAIATILNWTASDIAAVQEAIDNSSHTRISFEYTPSTNTWELLIASTGVLVDELDSSTISGAITRGQARSMWRAMGEVVFP